MDDPIGMDDPILSNTSYISWTPSYLLNGPTYPMGAISRAGLLEPIGRDGCVASSNAMLDYYNIAGTVGEKVCMSVESNWWDSPYFFID